MTIAVETLTVLSPNGSGRTHETQASPRERFAGFIDERTGPIGRVAGSEREPAGSHLFAIWVSDDAVTLDIGHIVVAFSEEAAVIGVVDEARRHRLECRVGEGGHGAVQCAEEGQGAEVVGGEKRERCHHTEHLGQREGGLRPDAIDHRTREGAEQQARCGEGDAEDRHVAGGGVVLEGCVAPDGDDRRPGADGAERLGGEEAHDARRRRRLDVFGGTHAPSVPDLPHVMGAR